jgi:hypothetical protein
VGAPLVSQSPGFGAHVLVAEALALTEKNLCWPAKNH